MNKKERLLNLAKEKFEGNKYAELLLLGQYIVSDDGKRFYLETRPIVLKDVESLRLFIRDYDNNLIRKTLEIDFDGCQESFKIYTEMIAKNKIVAEDECLQGIYWQSNEDKEIFN